MKWILMLAALVSAGAADKFPRALPKVALERVMPDLKVERPIWMEQVGDKFFVVEQKGRIVTVKKGDSGAAVTEFLNIVDRKPFVDNEEGLLGLAFHPEFAANRQFYVYWSGHNPRRSVISEFKVIAGNTNGVDMSSERVVMEVPQPFPNHNGGQIGFGPDGFLYIALGDGGAANDPNNNSQNMANLLGKILRIDVNARQTVDRRNLGYGIPKDNPYAGLPNGVRGEIWAHGLRNVWRFSWDRETKQLWAGEVGQNLWEEIVIVRKGGNYGWPVRESFHPFKPGPEGAKYDEPVAEYPHNPQIADQSPFAHEGIGLSITGGYVYRGKKHPALRGVYIYADYAIGHIYGLKYENGKVTDQARLLEQPKNVMSFAEDADGEVYMLAQDGGIYEIGVEAKK